MIGAVSFFTGEGIFLISGISDATEMLKFLKNKQK